MHSSPDNATFQFKSEEEANAFRETIYTAGLKFCRPIYWHDNAKPFPKEVTGASCFFIRFSTIYVGVTAAHVVREYQRAKAITPTLVCQLYLMPFNLEGALIDIDDAIDIATFSISECEIQATSTVPFDVALSWPPQEVVKQGAAVQLVGYPENIRAINSIDRSAIFQAWGALDFVEDFNDSEILMVYDPKRSIGAPTPPPLGYNMSGCSGGPAIIHETRAGLHRWHPVGLIVAGPKSSEGATAEFDMIRIRRIDCIEPTGQIRRAIETGWLP